jgi:hypothetical protein
VSTGSGTDTGLDDGLAMQMLETRDPVDAVIDFYSKRMLPADDRFKPTRTDDQQDGHRVVRLSLPQPDGGLQTVEAREDAGKTTIQLLDMKGRSSKQVPTSIPGVDPLTPTTPGTGPGSTRATTTIPRDPSISGPPIDIPPQPPLRGR